jgi:predicted ribosome quality control (RQC) complex YloA/Tae2 family protein
MHAQGYAGTHVILSLPERIKSIEQVPDASLEEAALLAAFYSRGKEAEKIPVDYTFRSNVKKPRGARPGMVIYDNYWTIYVNPSDPRLQLLLDQQQTAES